MIGFLDQLPITWLLLGGGLCGLIYFIRLHAIWPFDNDVRPASREELEHIPEVRFEGDNSPERQRLETKSLLQIGYDKYLRHGLPFRIRHPVGELGYEVFLPLKYLDEVKRAPMSLFSFEAYSEKSALLNYIHAPRQTDAAAQVVRVEMNRSLGAMLDDIWHEGRIYLEDNVPTEWTTVAVYPFLCSFVSRDTSVALVGTSLCRNTKWQEIVIQTTIATFSASNIVKDNYSPRWRWLANWSESIQRDLKKIRKDSHELLAPLYKERQDAMANEGYSADASAPYRDIIWWLLGSKQPDRSLTGIVESELFLSMTSIHTTSATLYSILCDWIAHPEYHEDIKCEVNECLAKVKANNGKWTLQLLASMRRLDSFFKESARVHPLGFISTQRYSLKPHTFKDGFHLPAGTTLMYDIDGTNFDPDNYPDPHTFDGYRFLRLREEVDPNRFHYASVSDTALGFGAGLHACPGRFLSAVIMKLFLIQFMTNYEIRYERGGIERPPSIYNDLASRLDPTLKVQVRRVA
ncbi:Cytochrome p450 [Colletotrichum higginsianum IMI 349063]|uniref:Cytochrome p450 n=2 Tax=Colletotrichum higginsianum (strain IMI 349063) TaxID=759273 RepID=A0A1B7YLX6_COLHI|nr:Cytochrome p450 [Colletotrichum higginsianum IMI 349063]OBR13046.1 Cytochrome p450 [Colletotrichum higginsianum IMI 349063]